ncbi:Uncharacterised protein [Bordetella pertussis]|nr:Uncharacterised protein [Bordetella pertussis]
MKLVTLQISDATPQSASSSSWAAITSHRMVPEPISCTRCLPLPCDFSLYMPRMMPSSSPAVRPGCG